MRNKSFNFLSQAPPNPPQDPVKPPQFKNPGDAPGQLNSGFECSDEVAKFLKKSRKPVELNLILKTPFA